MLTTDIVDAEMRTITRKHQSALKFASEVKTYLTNLDQISANLSVITDSLRDFFDEKSFYHSPGRLFSDRISKIAEISKILISAVNPISGDLGAIKASFENVRGLETKYRQSEKIFLHYRAKLRGLVERKEKLESGRKTVSGKDLARISRVNPPQ